MDNLRNKLKGRDAAAFEKIRFLHTPEINPVFVFRVVAAIEKSNVPVEIIETLRSMCMYIESKEDANLSNAVC
ncbi:MAG: hypothetical protein ABIL68_11165 [bacterium]